ncbi:MAG: bifunctional demethylmenaquinone methyltransferase/2-methoxy-6-polyprenyl-1,4-benzoquinol methylase UbiE [Desulfobacteraceae bacterium]|nr:bifunctional demethylmenaquinone methyltransferase/2-methoxy-6-polyprenyl-1,4-benzoquinol methylase UbiE [Desulfobacteraceae bacterium]
MDNRIKEQAVMAHFTTVARRYDLMNTLLSFGIHHLWKRKAIGMMNLSPGNNVLDLCGGTGDLAILAKKAVGKAGKVVLYDINREMMQVGKHSTSFTDIRSEILYVQGNAEKISFSDKSFDVVTVGFGVRNLTHLEIGFREMYRILRPGGTMMCLEFSEPVNPVFRRLYDMYSFHIMPRLGEMIAGSRQAYTYLPESIRLFPKPDKLCDILENIGFSDVSYCRLTNGIAAIHIGVKKNISSSLNPSSVTLGKTVLF